MNKTTLDVIYDRYRQACDKYAAAQWHLVVLRGATDHKSADVCEAEDASEDAQAQMMSALGDWIHERQVRIIRLGKAYDHGIR